MSAAGRLRLLPRRAGPEPPRGNLAAGHEIFGNEAEIAAGTLVAGEERATLRLACTSVNQGICANPASTVWAANDSLIVGFQVGVVL